MRRAAFVLLCLLLAPGLWAAAPFALDQQGVLWKAASTREGLLLTAELNGQEIVRSLVPYVVGIAGSEDRAIQVAADELTGKVAVVWQRHFAEGYSQIMLGVWQAGTWERVEPLTGDFSLDPRYPQSRLSKVETTVLEDVEGQEEPVPVTYEDSFLHVAWWEGSGETQHGAFGLLRLTAPPDDESSLTITDLDSLIPVGTGCETLPPQEVLEHPLFASISAKDRAFVFFGSRRMCLLHLAEVSFALEPEPDPESTPSFTVRIQRRRHMPIFGVRRVFQVPEAMDLTGARMLVGANLQPVAYKVQADKILYVTAKPLGWSPAHTLPVRDGLTMDQAIPLVEELAR